MVRDISCHKAKPRSKHPARLLSNFAARSKVQNRSGWYVNDLVGGDLAAGARRQLLEGAQPHAIAVSGGRHISGSGPGPRIVIATFSRGSGGAGSRRYRVAAVHCHNLGVHHQRGRTACSRTNPLGGNRGS